MSADNVVHLEVLQGDGFVLDADSVLSGQLGNLHMCVVVGLDEDGDLVIAGTHGSAESVFIMERAKLLFLESDCAR